MNEQFEITRKFWGSEITRGNLIWPDEFVIRFVKRNYRNKENTVILDFGCGAGRNAVALASEGYEIIAMDYTEEAIAIVNEKKGTLPIKAIKNKGLEIPVAPGSIDAVIADGSLFYNNIEDTIIILKNIRKALKTGGKFWANWRSMNDSLYGKGELLDNGLYKLEAGSKREGCNYLFCNPETLQDIYCQAGFEIESIDRHSYTENNGKNLCEWHFVVAVNNG